MMTVKELRELLDQFDDDMIVIIACDSSNSPLADVTEGHYIPENGWNGDFVDLEESEDDEDINLEDADRAIALWPTN